MVSVFCELGCEAQDLVLADVTIVADPAIDVLNLARAHNKDHPLLRVTLGEPASMERALKAVKRGMSAGSWVILENCHLASKWSEEFMHELEVCPVNR